MISILLIVVHVLLPGVLCSVYYLRCTRVYYRYFVPSFGQTDIHASNSGACCDATAFPDKQKGMEATSDADDQQGRGGRGGSRGKGGKLKVGGQKSTSGRRETRAYNLLPRTVATSVVSTLHRRTLGTRRAGEKK